MMKLILIIFVYHVPIQKVPIIEFYLKIRADYPRQCIGVILLLNRMYQIGVSTVSVQTKIGNRTPSNNPKNNNNKNRKGPGVGKINKDENKWQ